MTINTVNKNNKEVVEIDERDEKKKMVEKKENEERIIFVEKNDKDLQEEVEKNDKDLQEEVEKNDKVKEIQKVDEKELAQENTYEYDIVTSIIIRDIIKREKLDVLVVCYGGCNSNALVNKLEENGFKCTTAIWRELLCHTSKYIDVDIPTIYIYENPIKAFLSQKKRGNGIYDVNQRKLSNNYNIELSDENLLKLMFGQFEAWTKKRKDNLLVIKSREIFDVKIKSKLDKLLGKNLKGFPLIYKEPSVNENDKNNFKSSELYKKYKLEIQKINCFEYDACIDKNIQIKNNDKLSNLWTIYCEKEIQNLSKNKELFKILKEVISSKSSVEIPNKLLNDLKKAKLILKNEIVCPNCLQILNSDIIKFKNCGHKYCNICYDKISTCLDCKLQLLDNIRTEILKHIRKEEPCSPPRGRGP